MKKANRFTLFLNLLTFLLVIGLLIPSGTAMGQDDQDKEEFVLEEIVITGSRIVRNNMDSVSPIVTVDEKLFDQSATAAIETQLNKLPQFVPTIDVPAQGGDIQPTARNTPGEATVALRGLGANRSLVLINGRRGTPSNGGMYVDINSIPAMAIEYVEAISGGASSTYGADAMAGVINFILRDKFVGLQVDAQTGITQEGDGFEYQVSGIMGSDFPDDRGNVSMAFAYNQRNAAFQRDRDWYRELWADPSVGGTQFFTRFTGFQNDSNNPVDVTTLNTVIDGATFATSPAQTTIFADDYGNAFTGWGPPWSTPGVSGIDPSQIDQYMLKLQANGNLGYNNVTNYLVLPMQRYNMYARGNYEINDWVGLFAQGIFSKSNTLTIQEPSPIIGGWSFMIDPTVNRSVIPAELLTLLDSRDNGGGFGSGADEQFQVIGLWPFNRDVSTENYTYNIVAGLEGEIPGFDWTWELFVSQGESETSTMSRGYGSLERTKAIMAGYIEDLDGDGTLDPYPNFGQLVQYKGNPDNGGFGASTAICTSGLNPFDWDSVTDDCWNAVLADIKSKQVMKQTIWEFNAQGHIIDLPAGEARGAVGYSTRENVWYFSNDTLTTEGRSFLDQALGLYPADNSEGYIETDEYYGEAIIPLLKDAPLIKQLNLEIGGRSSDYNTTGSSNTYKALFDWRTNSWLRFRGGFNKAERAPNMAELFLSPEQSFAAAGPGGDVCSYGNLQSWGANPTANPDHWADVVNLCGQLMEATGDTGADDYFYGYDYRTVADGTNVPNTNWGTGSGAVTGFPHAIGNPDLHPETGDTWTVGAVINSPFEENKWLSDWRVSIDYYRIHVTDAIALQSGDVVMQQCVDPRFNPTFDPNSPYCDGFRRNQQGMIGDIQLPYSNNGEFDTSGIDISINWSTDLGPGRFGIDHVFNYLIEKLSTEFVGTNPMVDYTGTLGTTQNGLNGNSYEWQALTEFSYTYQDLRLSLRWQYLDSLEPEAYATTGTTYTGPPKYSLFDLLGSYNLTDTIWLRFGIENLFNKKPPKWNVNTAATDGMYGGTYYPPGTGIGYYYDTNGRRFYLGARMYFE